MQQAVNSLISRVVNHGIRHVIICPGSRSAPLALAFTRHKNIECFSLVDERSAAYTALGMAVALEKPVAIVCTSGTAVLNLYPAICEAYYSQIPLLVITADRPPELIDQWDGQCIRQTHIFEKHCLGSFTFDPLQPDPEIDRALQLCLYPVMGPVHINVPLSEPLYAGKKSDFTYEGFSSFLEPLNFAPNHLPGLPPYQKILVLAGADFRGARFKKGLKALKEQNNVVVIADIISGLHDCQTTANWDALLTSADEQIHEILAPELLITVGKFTVSKALKNFLKKHKPLKHWHVTANHTLADPFQTGPEEIGAGEEIFLEWLTAATADISAEFNSAWKALGDRTGTKIDGLFAQAPFNEFSAVRSVFKKLPSSSVLHVSNSMPVRYASYLSTDLQEIRLYANRGTSGIDGCTSTAAGASMILSQPTFLLCGDLSFFYDLNGLWNNYLKPNFKVIVLNNAGGGIFRLIDGPNDLPEREQFFSTHSNRKAERMAEEFGLNYFSASDFINLNGAWKLFLEENSRPAILEIFVDPDQTAGFYERFKNLDLTL